MMRTTIGLLISTVLFGAAASAHDIDVESLYESRSLVPGLLLPFKVGGATAEAGKLRSVHVSTTGGDCRVMLDPFLPRHFLLKCASETQARLVISIVSGGQTYNVNYGPLNITNPAPGSVIVKPPTSEDPEVLAGLQRFNAHCVSCHAAEDKPRRTFQQIKTAIATEPGMQGLTPPLSSLSDADLKKIEAYLKTF